MYVCMNTAANNVWDTFIVRFAQALIQTQEASINYELNVNIISITCRLQYSVAKMYNKLLF